MATAITHGIYVFLDEVHDNRPYVGKSKNDLVTRIRQHVRGDAHRASTVVAKIQVDGGKAELQIIEQLIYDVLSGGDPDTVSNGIRPMSATRPNKAALRARLSQLKVCK